MRAATLHVFGMRSNEIGILAGPQSIKTGELRTACGLRVALSKSSITIAIVT